MTKLTFFAKRKAGLTREAFRDRYEAGHVPLAVAELPQLHRYVRNHIAVPDHEDEPDYDVVTELWFDDKAGMEQDSNASQARGILARDEEEFFDLASMSSVLVADQVADVDSLRRDATL